MTQETVPVSHYDVGERGTSMNGAQDGGHILVKRMRPSYNLPSDAGYKQIYALRTSRTRYGNASPLCALPDDAVLLLITFLDIEDILTLRMVSVT
jgi:hypothetical protein